MKISPLDIRKQDFTRTLRGFDADEVGAFLDMLSQQWQELLDERRRQDETVRDLRSKIEHYERVEEALQEALQTARRNAEKTLESAEREAKAILKEAEAEAREIKADAKERRDRLKNEAAQVGERRGEIVARLRAFLMSEMELLARFEGDDPVGFIKLLPAETQRHLQQLSAEELSANQLDADEAPAPRRAPERSRAGKERGEEEHPRPVRQRRSGGLENSDPESSDPERQPSEEAPEERAAVSGASGEATTSDDAPDGATASNEAAAPSARSASRNAPEGGTHPEDLAAADDADDSAPGWTLNALFSAGSESSGGSESPGGGEAADRAPEVSAPDDEASPAPKKRGLPSDAVPDAVEDAAASTEEMEKIRRILNNMD